MVLLEPAALLVERGLETGAVEGAVDGFGRLRSDAKDGARGVVKGRLGGIEDFTTAGLLESEAFEVLSRAAFEAFSGVLPLGAAAEGRAVALSGGGMVEAFSFFRGLISIEYIGVELSSCVASIHERLLCYFRAAANDILLLENLSKIRG